MVILELYHLDFKHENNEELVIPQNVVLFGRTVCWYLEQLVEVKGLNLLFVFLARQVVQEQVDKRLDVDYLELGDLLGLLEDEMVDHQGEEYSDVYFLLNHFLEQSVGVVK